MTFLRQLKGELRKLFGRRRTYIGYGVFLVMELLILFVFKLERSQRAMRELVERNGLGFDDYYSSLTITYCSCWAQSISRSWRAISWPRKRRTGICAWCSPALSRACGSCC